MSIPLLITLGALAIGAFILMIIVMLSGTSPQLEDRLSTISHRSSGSRSRSSNSQRQSRSQSKKVVIPEEERRKKLAHRLIQAGLYRQNSIGYFILTQLLLAGIPVGFAFVLATSGWLTSTQALAVGLVTGISGILFPGLWLDAKKRSRQTAIRRALPDALDVIVVCVEAGLSLAASLVRVSKELRQAHPMLATEFTIVHREVQLGATTGKALRNLSNRFDLEELRSLASVVQQTERFGASVVAALRVHADALRERRLQLAKERAQQATVKILFPTVLCIFPSMFVVILAPAVFDIIEVFSRYGG